MYIYTQIYTRALTHTYIHTYLTYSGPCTAHAASTCMYVQNEDVGEPYTFACPEKSILIISCMSTYFERVYIYMCVCVYI